MQKSFKNFLETYSQNPELDKKTWRMGGVSWAQFKESPNDYYAANTGAVPGCIYYTDTVKFGKKNHLLILQAIAEFESECGLMENKPSPTDETEYFNWLTWFAWENMAGNLISYLENED